MDEPLKQALKWLLMEGAVPLLGASVLYLLYGGCRWLVSTKKSAFALPWKPAVDALGWLYGAIIIAVQTGWKGLSATGAGYTPYWAFFGAAGCFMVLLAAMNERGQDPTWEPPIMLQLFAGVMVVAILYAGFEVHSLVPGVSS